MPQAHSPVVQAKSLAKDVGTRDKIIRHQRDSLRKTEQMVGAAEPHRTAVARHLTASTLQKEALLARQRKEKEMQVTTIQPSEPGCAQPG